MSFTDSERPQRVRLPRPRRLLEPMSVVDAPFFGGAGFYARVGALGLVAVVAFGILSLRLWSLQVLHSIEYTRVVQHQSFRLVDLPAPRGVIVDARGRLLAGTTGRLVLTADAGALGRTDADGTWWPSARGRRALSHLARLTGVPRRVLVRRIRHSLARAPVAPAVVLPRVRRPLAFFLAERARDFPALSVTALPERSYPQGALGSEFLGLLGEINRNQLGTPRYRGTAPGEAVGQSGVEATYESLLRGKPARERIPVDVHGRVVGGPQLVARERPARSLKLTIDARMQRAAERALRDGVGFAHAAGHLDAGAGAAVVMNARTGALYALASYPDFSQVAAAGDPGYLTRLLSPRNTSVPLFDRATQGLYATGSTFKPIVAEAALASGIISRWSVLPCTGSLTVGNTVFHNVEPAINAQLTLPQALAISCDTWFYRLGVQFYRRQQTGHLDMQTWARRLGLGHRTGLDLPGEAGGVVPTPAWLRATFRAPWERIWYEGTSVNLSIGQGYLAVTPLQLAVAYAALANGGLVVRPHVAAAVLDPSRRLVRRLAFPPRARFHLADVAAIRDGLFAATHTAGGTSSAIFGGFPVPVAGKTGTAEAPPGSDHSWYASWAPASNPKVVVVVLIEHGGFGAQAAAPAAREIYSAFFRVPRARASSRP